MSFDSHDRCRRCGADDTASHTTAECARILRERAEAQRLHDTALPVLTRRSDGARFTITLQARSPEGPCQLRGVDPPHEIVETRNHLLDRDFVDPRTSQRVHDATHGAARCGHGKVCEWMRDAIDECNTGNARNVVFARREFKHPDTLRMVARVQVAIGLREPANVRACPACGGNPNEQEPVSR